MRVGKIHSNTKFTRALRTDEIKSYKRTVSEAKEQLNTGKTTATIFDFSVPSAEHNTGIGTSFSNDAQNLVSFLNTLCGVNAIQLQPQGEISNNIRSPYSGTSFSLGAHIIDLTKLANDNYGNLLNEEDINSSYFNRVKNHTTIDYDNVFSEDGQRAVLKNAYQNFSKLDETHPLKKEFIVFKNNNSFWLEKDALFEAAAIENGTRNADEWPHKDKYLFATKEGDISRINELKETTDEDNVNVVEFEEFVQFIADKQQKESKANFNSKGIEIYGDCQIGFSQKDVWAHRSAFYPNYEFGCKIADNAYSCWSRAIDFSKLDGDAGELLFEKFDKFFKRYDGVRIDAAWQLIKPLICEPIKENGDNKFDNNGNKLGKKLHEQPVIGDNGAKIMKDIILKAADNNNIPHDRIYLELLGGNSYESINSVKDLGMQLIHVTRYGSETWGRVKHYEKTSDNRYQNMKPGQYSIGPGTHDDISMLEQVDNSSHKIGYLSKDLYIPEDKLTSSKIELLKAMFAELFTTKNQFVTLPDILGSERRINAPNTIEGNWTYRAPQNYEQSYYTNLSDGKGLNLPDALSKAIKAKQNGNSTALADRLDFFAKILSEKGPMTTKEADALNINA